jgi:hypothetical protein
VALFSEIIIDPSRPSAESDISMLHEVVTFLSKVASQEQDTYLDYVLALCSDFENAARKEVHRIRNPEPGHTGNFQSNTTQLQGQTYAQDIYPPQASFMADLNHHRVSRGDESHFPPPNILAPEQSLYPSGQLPLPAPLSWNWQDMLAGVPPAYDYGSYDLGGTSEQL